MAQSRRTFLQTSAIGIAATRFAASVERKRPNILIIHDDQHRGMDLGCAGNDQVITPHLDRLASEGICFTNAIANNPLCTPSRGIFLTGKYPLSHRAFSNDLPLATGQETFATVLKTHGYKTGYIGKWHLDGIPRGKFTPPGPRRQGFEDYWAVYNCHHNYFKTKYFRETPNLIEREGYEPAIQTDLAIEFLQTCKNEPFCLMISWGPPHAPYDLVPEPYRKLYDPASIALRKNCKEDHRRVIADYYAHITALDDNVARLLATLDERGLREETIVMFTSDHGDMLWSHGYQKKQKPWEESIRVPLIIRAPGLIPAGKRSDLLFSTADVAPTLLGLAGLAAPAEMEGTDLSRNVVGEGGEEPHSVFILDVLPCDQARQFPGRPWRGVRTKRHTYARWPDGKGWVLYDNIDDPFQLRNLMDHSDHAALRRELEAELQTWLQKTNDPFLETDEMLAALGFTEIWQKREEHFRTGENW
ncbi:MAG: DUF229 domain-containing protein [Candidatus Omnitrophota bacterium]|jgi:arylsulfatase A-like enzyme|nr:MAG: DUF229 domain-containing protein [Candidatus Omnitrophota bacterium]